MPKLDLVGERKRILEFIIKGKDAIYPASKSVDEFLTLFLNFGLYAPELCYVDPPLEFILIKPQANSLCILHQAVNLVA